VSAPFHSSLMKPAAERLKIRLADTELAQPKLALVNNIDVAIESDSARIRDALYRQAFGPVRWVETVQAMRARGVAHFIECGPGRVLTALVRRIDVEAIGIAMHDPASLADAKGMLG
jgi:[acyl-carrier-protein] S-malonyltransferase